MSDLNFMLSKTFGVRVARVVPVAEKAFTIRGNPPEQAAVFQLRIFPYVDAVHEHGALYHAGSIEQSYKFGPSRMGAVAGLVALQFRRKQIDGRGNDQSEPANLPSSGALFPTRR